jgi:hypothetical protein
MKTKHPAVETCGSTCFRFEPEPIGSLLSESIFRRTHSHSAGMYACTDEMSEIYLKMYKNLLKNPNKSAAAAQQNKT